MPNIFDARDTYGATSAFLVTRDELPLLLNARGLFGCGAEIGVKEGDFSARLLELWHGAHLISIDPWLSDAPEAYVDVANVDQTQHDRFYEATVARLSVFGGRSSIWRETSVEASRRIPHHSLDFVYLDARHDYDSVMEDLEAWFDRVRPGGVIAGHDYIDGHFTAGIFGVKSAVDEFFEARGLRVNATLDDEPWLTWVVDVPPPAALFAGAELPGESGIAAAPPPPPTPSLPDTVIGLSFSTPAGQHSVKLSLDPMQMSQRMMIQCLQGNQLYEPETSVFFANILQPGDTFIDVGTHVGYFSMLAATIVGPSGRVISFEPEPENFRRLGSHVAMNQFDQVEIVNAAVGENAGRGELFVNEDNDGGHALWDVGAHPFNSRSRLRPNPREVEVTCLDAYLAERDLSSVKLIKIDTEGSELRVLRGAQAILERFRIPFVVAEVNDFALRQMGAHERELRAYMESLGYQTFVFVPNTTQITPLALDQEVVSEHVYNLLFRHHTAPDFQAAA